MSLFISTDLAVLWIETVVNEAQYLWNFEKGVKMGRPGKFQTPLGNAFSYWMLDRSEFQRFIARAF
jgi:hypothetical protein